ncbi:MAG: Ig-like domain-containing protein [Bacteroidia bacterium]
MKKWMNSPAIMGMVAGFLISANLYAQKPYHLTGNNRSIKIPAVAGGATLKIFATDSPEALATIPPMLGKTEERGDSVEFIPTFPFRNGVVYSVVSGDRRWFTFSIPLKENLPLPKLEAIYPTADTVPANLLKIYLSFSQPMREGLAMNYLFLLDEKGDTLPGVFLDLQPELWDHSGKRLTVWFDPGRIKRDLVPNQLLGPPLNAGEKYTLLITKGWPDVHGNTLPDVFRRNITVTGADRQSPDVHKWKISSPDHNGLIAVHFGENMDRALLDHCLTILDTNDQPVPGKTTISDHESVWQFTPDQPWQPGMYKIRVDARLEDLAGNNLNRPFDRDMETGSQRDTDKPWFLLEFSIPE